MSQFHADIDMSIVSRDRAVVLLFSRKVDDGATVNGAIKMGAA